MQAIDKLKTDLDDWEKSSGHNPGHNDFDRLRTIFGRNIPKIPEDTMAALFASFLSRFGSGEAPRKALDWLSAIGSLLLCDFDNSQLDKEDWVEIRDLITTDSGEIDMDILSYVLGKALEHGAI
ncbi:hypothetical protein MASR2M29_11070 [Spirochaetota bacterium]